MTQQAISYCSRNSERFIRDLEELVRIPSCSFPGYPARELVRSAEAVAAYLRRCGLQGVRLLRIPGAHPYVYGEWLGAPGRPTVLLYAHHDVQPPGREELWKSPPYRPTRRGGRLYGRGAADDKAGICVHGSALAAYLKTAGKLPLNVKVIIEGEEEIGSDHLEKFLRRYARLLKADCIVLTDTGNYDTGIPSITTSLRGLVSIEVTVRTADHPLHSGMWGGPLPDPALALARMLATLTTGDGRVAIPGIAEGLRPPTPAERRALRSLKYNDARFRRESQLLPGVDIVGGRATPLEKMWRLPAVSVNAIEVSSRKNLSNIITESAWCHVGLRIGPGMDPRKALARLKAHLKAQAPWGARVEFAREGCVPAWTTDTGHPAFVAARRALARGYGRQSVFIGTGGSIPFVGPFARVLGGAPALLIGVEDPYTNPHSENESLDLGDYQKAIRGSVYLYDELSRLSKSGRRAANSRS